MGMGLDPGAIQAVSETLGVWGEDGCLESFHSSKLTRSQVQHDSGLIQARRNTQRWNENIKLEQQHLAAATPAGTSQAAIQRHVAVTLATWDAVWREYLHPKWAEQRMRLHGAQEKVLERNFVKGKEYPGLGFKNLRDQAPKAQAQQPVAQGIAEMREFVFDPDTQIGVGIDPGVTQAVIAASGVWDPQSGQLMADQLRRWKLTKGQVKHDSGLNNARRDTERWLAPIKPHLQHLAAASSAGTSLEANLKHITVTLATWDAVWEVYLDPKWARQRLRLYGAQARALEQFFNKLEEKMAELSMERHNHAKQLVVFFGAASIGTAGGWGADAVLRACRKVVCRPRGTDQLRGRVVLVDEHRTTRVSSAVNGKQPCEVELNTLSATRPAGWKPPAGQEEQRLLRPAWSQQRDQPAEPTKGKGKGKAAKAKPAPQPGRWLDRDCNAALNMQRIGESRWRPLELCWWPDQGALPAKGKEYPGLGYKRAPRSSQDATPAAVSEPGPSTPPPAKRSKRTKAAQAAEPTNGEGKAKGKAAKVKPAPQPGRWLDRDCNAALNIQRIGESRWRPLELCWWPDLPKLPAKSKEVTPTKQPDSPASSMNSLDSAMLMFLFGDMCLPLLQDRRMHSMRCTPEYPGLGYKRLRDKPPKTQQQQQQQQPAEAQYSLAEQAVASLHSAGDDQEALEEAIQAAAFLDAIPGDDRQKLRAARFRLRKIKEVAAKGVASADRSPHIKAEYNPAEFDVLTSVDQGQQVPRYEKLSWRMLSRPGGAIAKPDDFYRLYALHMQVTQGDNTTERPMWAERGGLDFDGRARWDAWTALKGLDTDKARLRFVRLYYEFTPAALYKDTRGGQ
ncbi:hypothetical protein QJQ45_030476 [Haematococcus lacustris]|nr:hypothetical protein QJQ45_030476 [Haematococcus lacustris]